MIGIIFSAGIENLASRARDLDHTFGFFFFFFLFVCLYKYHFVIIFRYIKSS
jgi:hypothetical protein